MTLENAIKYGNGEIGNFRPLICQKKEIRKGRWKSVLGHEARGKEVAKLV